MFFCFCFYLGGLVVEDLVEVEGLGDVREGLLLDGDLPGPRAGDDRRGTGLALVMVQRPKTQGETKRKFSTFFRLLNASSFV